MNSWQFVLHQRYVALVDRYAFQTFSCYFLLGHKSWVPPILIQNSLVGQINNKSFRIHISVFLSKHKKYSRLFHTILACGSYSSLVMCFVTMRNRMQGSAFTHAFVCMYDPPLLWSLVQKNFYKDNLKGLSHNMDQAFENLYDQFLA